MKKCFLLLFTCLLFSQCDLPVLREIPVGDKELLGFDTRLFQGTVAWDLAKAVADDDSAGVERILCKHPEVIDVQEPRYGKTVLMQSIYCRKYKAFLALLRNGADVNIHEYLGGDSPLNIVFRHSIKDSSCLKYVENLVEYGADVNDIGRGVGGLRLGGYYNHSNTPLMDACESEQFECVKFLIENGADINLILNPYGGNALYYALVHNNNDIAIYLLEHGADYRIPLFYCPRNDGSNLMDPKYIEDFISMFSDKFTPQQLKKIRYLISQEYKAPSILHNYTIEHRNLQQIRNKRYRKIKEQGRSYVY